MEFNVENIQKMTKKSVVRFLRNLNSNGYLYIIGLSKAENFERTNKQTDKSEYIWGNNKKFYWLLPKLCYHKNQYQIFLLQHLIRLICNY